MRIPMLYIADIINSINRIEEYTGGVDYDSFLNSQMMVDAVIRNLEIIGEAAGNVPNELKDKYNEIPWQEMKGLRNVLIHEYFGVSTKIVWNIVIKEIPQVKEMILRVIQEEGDFT
jgi:uncharacterized protein with HEPN domain